MTTGIVLFRSHRQSETLLTMCQSGGHSKNRTVLAHIARSFHYKDKFVKLYKTEVRPHLEFCTPTWSPWNKTDRDCLEKIQMKMVQMISGLSGSYTEKLAVIGLETLEARRLESDICMAHKLLHGIGDLNPDIWFDKMPVNHVTRAGADPLNLKPRLSNTDIRKYFFSTRVVKYWNNLPHSVKCISSPAKFKMALRNWTRGVPLELQHGDE
jgi:hypothetical protein